MTIIRTNKDILTPEEIIEYITNYERDEVPNLDKLWQYYMGKNCTIINKRATDVNNPDNRTPVSYGRKIITTFTGYAYRPRYITYKSDNSAYMDELNTTFRENNEHIKTSQHGRNTGIFGVSYELLYLGESSITGNPEIKFCIIDPREMILLYDYSIEAKPLCAIRFYKVSDELWKVNVFYKTETINYDMKRDKYKTTSLLIETSREPNYFEDIPVIAYYLGQDIQGLLEPVLPLIDDYDILVSDSMNEFDRFSHAYLRLVKMSLSDQVKSSSPGVFQSALAALKQRRVFEQLPDKDAVSFLTKDIPTEYIKFMTMLVRDQIHIQSHVPDLGSGAFADGVSGVAVDRLMFDFENVVSNAEAEFDTALYNRIRLITNIYKIQKRAMGTFDEITISHKRNKPQNIKEYADTALTMSQAGLSRYLVADIFPDDIIPDVEKELERQDEDREGKIPDVEAIAPPEEEIEDEVEEEPEEPTNG